MNYDFDSQMATRNLLSQAKGRSLAWSWDLKLKEQAPLPICLWLTHLSPLILPLQGKENLG